MNFLNHIGMFFRERQRLVLIAMLAVLHLTLLAGAETSIALMCWLVDVGLFLLWQPFIQAERRIDGTSFVLLAALLAIGIWLFSDWLLILWVVVLASLLGGRVMLLMHRPTRIFYLLAFAYLLGAELLWLVPRVVPATSQIGLALDGLFVWCALPVLGGMLLLSRSQEAQEYRASRNGIVDFFYSLFIFLLIAVLVLGSLAFMLLRQSLYVEAVFKTLVSIALILLLIAWAWNPRPGFSGIGLLFSRYLLSLVLPFENWLQRLMEVAKTESDPDDFMRAACTGLLEMQWVKGGEWRAAQGMSAGSGCFGAESHCRHEFPGNPLVLTLYTQHPLSPSLLWHFHLLVQLACEYYVAKQREQELKQVSYLRAVHETGARLTHDIKNLLQSLNNLCFMVQSAGEDKAGQFNLLLQRQLPQITVRLQQTLEKLQAPAQPYGESSVGSREAARRWWAALQQRYARNGIEFVSTVLDASAQVPLALYDSVADNLLHNALIKRQSESGLTIRVSLSSEASVLSVTDSGSPVREWVLRGLLHAPVPSENGLGIGLYHAARQAENHGYELRLAANENGNVCFELRQAE